MANKGTYTATRKAKLTNYLESEIIPKKNIILSYPS